MSLRMILVGFCIYQTLFFIFGQEDGWAATLSKYPSKTITGENTTLKCHHNASKQEVGVDWWNGTGISTGLTYTNTCQPGVPLAAYYDLSRISASCDSTRNIYNITITTTSYDTKPWRCCFLFENGDTHCSSPVSFNDTEDDKTTMYVAVGLSAAVSLAGILSSVAICCA